MRADASFQPLVVLQHVADMLDAELACRRQPQTAWQAFEERGAHLFLQRKDLPVDRRRRDVQPRRRLPDRSRAGDLVDVEKLPGVQHAQPRCINFEHVAQIRHTAPMGCRKGIIAHAF